MSAQKVLIAISVLFRRVHRLLDGCLEERGEEGITWLGHWSLSICFHIFSLFLPLLGDFFDGFYGLSEQSQFFFFFFLRWTSWASQEGQPLFFHLESKSLRISIQRITKKWKIWLDGLQSLEIFFPVGQNSLRVAFWGRAP